MLLGAWSAPACVRLHLRRRSVGRPVGPCSIFLSRAISLRQPALISSSTGPPRSRPAKRPAARSVALKRILIAANHDFSGRVYTYFIAGHYWVERCYLQIIFKSLARHNASSHTQHKRRSISLRRAGLCALADANIIMREGLLCPDAHNKIKSQSPQPSRQKISVALLSLVDIYYGMRAWLAAAHLASFYY